MGTLYFIIFGIPCIVILIIVLGIILSNTLTNIEHKNNPNRTVYYYSDDTEEDDEAYYQRQKIEQEEREREIAEKRARRDYETSRVRAISELYSQISNAKAELGRCSDPAAKAIYENQIASARIQLAIYNAPIR